MSIKPTLPHSGFSVSPLGSPNKKLLVQKKMSFKNEMIKDNLSTNIAATTSPDILSPSKIVQRHSFDEEYDLDEIVKQSMSNMHSE